MPATPKISGVVRIIGVGSGFDLHVPSDSNRADSQEFVKLFTSCYGLRSYGTDVLSGG